MAQPSQINTLRATDFPSGLNSKGAVDKLFQILNPFLQQVGQTTTAGTSLGANIDGQGATATIAKGTAWQNMTLGAKFAAFATGNDWREPSYKVENGRCWLRGLMSSTSTPTTNDVIWTLPSADYAPSESGSNRMFMLPLIDSTANSGHIIQRIDLTNTDLHWFAEQFAWQGWVNSWTTLPLSANWVTAGQTPGYRKDGSGRVWLRGSAGISAANVSTGVTFATLPADYRPAVQMDYGGTFDGAASPLEGGIIRIETSGACKVFFGGGAQKVNTLPLGQVSFDTDPIQPNVGWATLDQISWDIVGGTSITTRPGFPLNVRLKDGKKPVAVLCWAYNDDTKCVDSISEPSWTYNGTGNTGNTLTINAVSGLRDNYPYTLNFFIFF